MSYKKMSQEESQLARTEGNFTLLTTFLDQFTYILREQTQDLPALRFPACNDFNLKMKFLNVNQIARNR